MCRNYASFLPGKFAPSVNHIDHLNAGCGDSMVDNVVRVRHDFPHGGYRLALPEQVFVTLWVMMQD
jgi:hypothetical protein